MSQHNYKVNKCEDMNREARLLKRAILKHSLKPAKAKYADMDLRKGGGHLPKEWR